MTSVAGQPFDPDKFNFSKIFEIKELVVRLCFEDEDDEKVPIQGVSYKYCGIVNLQIFDFCSILLKHCLRFNTFLLYFFSE